MAALLFLRRRVMYNLRNERVCRDRFNPFEVFDDVNIIERYRLPREAILTLVDLLTTTLEHPTKRSHAIPVYLQVLIALRFYAKGSFLSETGDIHGVSRAKACICIASVTNAICTQLNLIKFPSTQEEVEATKLDFFKVGNFPNVVGVVDGSLIPIVAPSDDEPSYICRKGYHAINIQAIADSKLRFTNVVCKFPGSVHDAYIWSTCAINNMCEAGEVDGWLLGDSGYPLRPWIMTPRANATTRGERAYNRALKTTRCIVERSFGVLKSRFRCLHKSAGGLLFKPQKCCKVIMAVCQLHNFCIDLKIPEPDIEPEDDDDDDDDDDPNYNNTGINDGKTLQDRLIETRFS